MSNIVSALPGAAYEGYVRIEEMGLQGMITLRGDLSASRVKKAVKTVAGVDVPGQRGIAHAGDTGAAWMSPDELLLLMPYAQVEDTLATLAEALAEEHHLAVNVSDARAMFRVHGAAAREIIAKLCPVDMTPGAFGPGRTRRTRMAQVAAALWMTDEETVQVVCFRSVAEYVFNLLRDAAEPGGEVGAF